MDVDELTMPNRRPDSDGQGCGSWTEGRPGTGVLYFPQLGRAPIGVKLGSGHYRLPASRAEAEQMKAARTLSGCQGDGHYMCGECIFFDVGELAQAGARASYYESAPLRDWKAGVLIGYALVAASRAVRVRALRFYLERESKKRPDGGPYRDGGSPRERPGPPPSQKPVPPRADLVMSAVSGLRDAAQGTKLPPIDGALIADTIRR